MIRYEYAATAVRVIDGDTVDVDVDLGFSVTLRQRLRLLGVNTPERGHVGWQQATDWLRAQCPAGAKLEIRTVKDRTEKYGRMLAHIRLLGDTALVNDRLVAEHPEWAAA